jgi:hypothetical protein
VDQIADILPISSIVFLKDMLTHSNILWDLGFTLLLLIERNPDMNLGQNGVSL